MVAVLIMRALQFGLLLLGPLILGNSKVVSGILGARVGGVLNEARVNTEVEDNLYLYLCHYLYLYLHLYLYLYLFLYLSFI